MTTRANRDRGAGRVAAIRTGGVETQELEATKNYLMGSFPRANRQRRRRPPLALHKVKLQFGGHRGRKIHFLGEDGTVREFHGFSRATNPRVAVASAAESGDIVTNLLPKASRLAWFVDMGDGFDSLEVSADGFSKAWQKLRCAAAQR